MGKPDGHKSGPWFGTFQGAMLCVYEPGVRIELQRVGWRAADAKVEPLAVDPVLRYVDAAGARRTGPIEAFRGTPQNPELLKPYPGRYRREIKGVVIDQPCSEIRNGGRNRNGFTELLFVVKAGDQGFDVPEAWIDYLADGQEYRLRLKWEMAGCGDAMADHEVGTC